MASFEQKQLKKQLQDLGKQWVKTLTNELLKADKKASGDLIKSLDYNVINTANGFVLEILSEPYLEYVDKGRRAGKQPPVKPITKWVKNRGIKFYGKSKEQTAFIIARSIGKKGIKPTYVIKKAQLQLMQNMEKLIQRAAVEDMQELIDRTFKNITK